jgi:radical SAM modification target selenobiotic family peptide
MDSQDLKKFLSGLCIASLLTGAGLTLIGCQQKAKTGEEEKPGAATQQEPQKEQPQKPSGS